ncbi:MAG: tRNA dihydrouridine synthase DusB [Thermodesulfobacteriota bacterium]
MKLGSLPLNGHLILAPMAGLTDYPFRRLAREHGCSLVFTEMVSAEGLLRKGKSFLRIGVDEHPLSVQLFGANPKVIAEAAQVVEGMGVDAIDINMGCPARQVVKTGAGADLMRFPEKVRGILIEVRKRVKCPLTVKIRSGWDRQHINAVEISKIAEESGIDAIFIHPRTRDQGFCGRADWNVIAQLKKAVCIPVVGNGDVTTPSLARKMLEETGCDGVMIGRGALGNPWIFDPKNFGSFTEESVIRPSLEERRRMISYHFSLLQEHYGEKGAMREIRKHAARYTKGLPSGVFFRSTLNHLKGSEEFSETLISYFESIQNISSEKRPHLQGGPPA